MAKVIMTNAEMIQRLKTLAARKTYYKNKYPDNLCYVHADLKTSADCVNLYKALFNGYDVDNLTPGYYQRNLSNTGDCSEIGLINQCSDVSKNFKNLKEGQFEVLYMKGHIGGYIGTTVINGNVYNVIEATGAWGGGILYSYVDERGGRYNYKGGKKNGTWESHGKATRWIDYGANAKVDYSKYPVLKKGSRGTYVRILQELLVAHGYNPNGIDGIFGNGCLNAVKKFQSENTDVNGNKLVVDGCVGQKTWGALYK